MKAILIAILLVLFLTLPLHNAQIPPLEAEAVHPAGRGALIGTVMRGPLSPVQSVGDPGGFAPAVGIEIIASNLATGEAKSAVTNQKGRYSLRLPPGLFRIETPPLPGIEFTKDLPVVVKIRRGHRTLLDILIDTGIR